MGVPLEVKFSCGMDGQEPSPPNAYLGVSFSKTLYFSRARMATYIGWACTRFENLLIIVADHLEVHNLRVFRDMSTEEAERRTLHAGCELSRAYRKAIPVELSSRVSVRQASDILLEPGCAELLSLVRRNADAEPLFKADLRDAVRQSLSGKLRALRPTHWGEDPAIDVLEQYMIEEIAIILYITCRSAERFHVSIFPYKPQDVILKVHCGPYAHLFSEVTGGHAFRALEVV